MGARQGVGALRSACLGARHAVVETLQEPGLETARVGGGGEPAEHRRGSCGTSDGWTVGMDLRCQEGGGPEVLGGGAGQILGRHHEHSRKVVVGPDEGTTTVGPAGGTGTQGRAPPHGCRSVHADSGFEGVSELAVAADDLDEPVAGGVPGEVEVGAAM